MIQYLSLCYSICKFSFLAGIQHNAVVLKRHRLVDGVFGGGGA